MPTKKAFLEAYRAALIANYQWAKQRGLLGFYMAQVENAINGDPNGLEHRGEMVKIVWQALGDELARGVWIMLGGNGAPTRDDLIGMPA